MSTQPGGSIGPYTIIRELGRGGMGLVYLATDERLDRQVAIKAPPEHLAADPDRRAESPCPARTTPTPETLVSEPAHPPPSMRSIASRRWRCRSRSGSSSTSAAMCRRASPKCPAWIATRAANSRSSAS